MLLSVLVAACVQEEITKISSVAVVVVKAASPMKTTTRDREHSIRFVLFVCKQVMLLQYIILFQTACTLSLIVY